MTGKLKDLKLMPVGKEHYGDEALCYHTESKNNGEREYSQGESLKWPDGKKRWVACYWQPIVCLSCKTKRILVK